MSKWCRTLKHSEESTYSVSFYPLLLSDTKRNELINRGKEIRDVRNEISDIFHGDMLRYQDMSKFDAFNLFNPMFTNRLSSHYLKKAIEDVWRAYQLRFDAIRKHIEFEQVTELVPTFYKRRTKKHNVGDLKSIERHTTKTELTKTLTWLARYGNSDTEYWLESIILTDIPDTKKKFYQGILCRIHKYGFERLMRLALSRRESVYTEYMTRGAIQFNSLSFSGRSRIKRPIIAKATKKGKFDYYAEISWDWTDDGYRGSSSNTMCIPVKYNKKYHRNLARYCNGSDTSYNMVIRGNDIHLVLARKGKRYTSDEDISEENTIGIDVNSKHNMFALSTGEFIPNDNALIADLEQELLKVDTKQKNYNAKFGNKHQEAFHIAKKDARRLTAISNKLNDSNKRTIARLCKRFASSGIKHIAMENLDGFQGSKLYAKDSNGVNLGRLHLRTGLSSLKDDFIHIAPRYGLSVSLVQSEYTSKMCGHCGCIDDRNRQTQEEFCCIECGHSENADIHSAKNIKFRLTSTVLRGYLLQAGDSGYRNFVPKGILPRWKVKKFLEKCRYDGLFKQSIENHPVSPIGKFA